MPILHRSRYPGPPLHQFNGHLQTILPALRRYDVPFERERLDTSDGDFLDLDWLVGGHRRLLVLTHGLEGSSRRPYMQCMADFFVQRGWDVLAWNCRSCGGELNRQLRLYHHGEIGDIGEVVAHALHTKNYDQVALVGFSMGGNITLKYLSVNAGQLPDVISGGVAFSAPSDLYRSVQAIDRRENALYRQRFRKALLKKIQAKAEQHPGYLEPERIREVAGWRDFDVLFSAPLNGYDSVEAFYEDASSINFVERLRTPALLVNAQNDPIVPLACAPLAIAENHRYLHVELPRQGGHVGFCLPRRRHTWMEERAWEFLVEGRV